MTLLVEPVTIRQACEADAAQVLPLVHAFMQAAPLVMPADEAAVTALLTTLCRTPSACVLVAEAGETVLGFAVAQCGPYVLNPAVAVVQEQAFYVCPAAEHQGIGRSLLAALEGWARQQGAACVLMSCFGGATRVAALYTAAGYRLMEQHYVKELR